jgi:hypothetical protein
MGMEAWALKPLLKILKKDCAIQAHVNTCADLHIISYNKEYRIWNVEWKMNNITHLVLEKKKINKYIEAIEAIVEIRIAHKDLFV